MKVNFSTVDYRRFTAILAGTALCLSAFAVNQAVLDQP